MKRFGCQAFADLLKRNDMDNFFLQIVGNVANKNLHGKSKINSAKKIWLENLDLLSNALLIVLSWHVLTELKFVSCTISLFALGSFLESIEDHKAWVYKVLKDSAWQPNVKSAQ